MAQGIQIKCHKCGKNHRKHGSFELDFANEQYYFKGPEGAVKVYVGATCAEKLFVYKKIK